jgi:hypothetical protein
MQYVGADTPTVVFAGEEYGTGSSRDWAAKGTQLLGVKAVIAESYERIHRSNLVGMGVLPLQFQAGQSAVSLGLTGSELIEIAGARNAFADVGAPYLKVSLEQVLARVPGVGEVEGFGGEYAMRIWLNPDKLTDYGLTVDDVLREVRLFQGIYKEVSQEA